MRIKSILLCMTCGWALCGGEKVATPPASGYSQALNTSTTSKTKIHYYMYLASTGTCISNMTGAEVTKKLIEIPIENFKFPIQLQNYGESGINILNHVVLEHSVPQSEHIKEFISKSLIGIDSVVISEQSTKEQLQELGKIIGLFIATYLKTYLPNRLDKTDLESQVRYWIIYNFKIVIDKLKTLITDQTKRQAVINGPTESLRQYLSSTWSPYTAEEKQLLDQINSPTTTR